MKKKLVTGITLFHIITVKVEWFHQFIHCSCSNYPTIPFQLSNSILLHRIRSIVILPLVACTIGPGFTIYAIDPFTQKTSKINWTIRLKLSMILTREQRPNVTTDNTIKKNDSSLLNRLHTNKIHKRNKAIRTRQNEISGKKRNQPVSSNVVRVINRMAFINFYFPNWL